MGVARLLNERLAGHTGPSSTAAPGWTAVEKFIFRTRALTGGRASCPSA